MFLLPKWEPKIPPYTKTKKLDFKYNIEIFPFHLSIVMSIYLVAYNSSDNHEISDAAI